MSKEKKIVNEILEDVGYIKGAFHYACLKTPVKKKVLQELLELDDFNFTIFKMYMIEYIIKHKNLKDKVKIKIKEDGDIWFIFVFDNEKICINSNWI